MIKVYATNLFVSKGYEDNPALRFFGENESCVQFRVGEKIYDKKAKDNTRWVNHTVKAFGAACERIKKMQMKEGSLINILGGTLTDEIPPEADGDKKTTKHFQVITLESRDSIEYVSGGGKKASEDEKKQPGTEPAKENETGNPEQSDNFAGYAPYDGNDFYGD